MKIIKTIGMSTIGVFSVGTITIPTMVLSSCSTADDPQEETKISIETENPSLTQDRDEIQTAEITTSVTPAEVASLVVLSTSTLVTGITFIDNNDGTGTLTVAAGTSIVLTQTITITATCDGMAPSSVDIKINPANTEITITTEDDITAVTQSYQADVSLVITASVTPDISNPIEWAIKEISPEYEEIITLMPNETDKNKAILIIKKGEEIKEDQKVTIAVSCGQTTSEIEITVNAFNNAEKLAYTEVEGGYSVGAAPGVTISGDLTIPETYNDKPIIEITNNGFDGQSGMLSINIKANLNSISSAAFHNCDSLTNIIIPSSVTSIANYAFQGCVGLKAITLPDKLITIKMYAFSNCKSLIRIVIPSDVRLIEYRAFAGCTALLSITMSSMSPPSLETEALSSMSAGYKIYVSASAIDTYRNTSTSGWTPEIKSHILPII